MLFQVIRGYDNKPMLRTEYESCIPYDDLESLDRAGYKFKLDGKAVSYKFMMNRRNLTVTTGGSADPLGLMNPSVESEEVKHSNETESPSEPVVIVHTDNATLNELQGTLPEETTVDESIDKPRSRKSKPVKCLETGMIYNNQAEAAKALNINPAYVSMSISSGKPAKGYTFIRVEDDNK